MNLRMKFETRFVWSDYHDTKGEAVSYLERTVENKGLELRTKDIVEGVIAVTISGPADEVVKYLDDFGYDVIIAHQWT